MPLGTLILVETSSAGNLGAAMRVAANFSVSRLHLVRPQVPMGDPEVMRWACGGNRRLEIQIFDSLEDAAAGARTLVATASGRGRENQPVITVQEAAAKLSARGLDTAALAFGNETSGLRREEIDLCDLTLSVTTDPEFPVLNLTQAIAIVLAVLSLNVEAPEDLAPVPAPHEQVDALMNHMRSALLAIEFIDTENPDRMLRKLRRLIGRAGITENEVAILRGICRQTLWAAKTGPLGDREDTSR